MDFKLFAIGNVEWLNDGKYFLTVMISLFGNYMKNYGNFNVTIDNDYETLVIVLVNFLSFNTFKLHKYNSSSL
jgi:hypothetical protein